MLKRLLFATAIALLPLSLGAPPFCPELLDPKTKVGHKFKHRTPLLSDISSGWLLTPKFLNYQYAPNPEAQELVSEIVKAFSRQDFHTSPVRNDDQMNVLGRERAVDHNKRYDISSGQTKVLVRSAGLEPARVLPHSDLNAARLPIPPRPRVRTGFCNTETPGPSQGGM